MCIRDRTTPSWSKQTVNMFLTLFSERWSLCTDSALPWKQQYNTLLWASLMKSFLNPLLIIRMVFADECVRWWSKTDTDLFAQSLWMWYSDKTQGYLMVSHYRMSGGLTVHKYMVMSPVRPCEFMKTWQIIEIFSMVDTIWTEARYAGFIYSYPLPSMHTHDHWCIIYGSRTMFTEFGLTTAQRSLHHWWVRIMCMPYTVQSFFSLCYSCYCFIGAQFALNGIAISHFNDITLLNYITLLYYIN